jgi:hypothetical protein
MTDVFQTIALIVMWGLVFSIGEGWARKLMRPAAAANSVPIDSAELVKHLGDLEHRHGKTRELLIGAISFATAALAGLYVLPNGMAVSVLVTGVTYALANLFWRWHLRD